MNKIIKYLIDDSGQSTILVAVLLTALLGFTGLAVDIGNVYLEKSKMQKALDAGVLAGAKEFILTRSETSAEEMGDRISEENGYSLDVHGNANVSDEFYGKVVASDDEYYVEAYKSKNVDTYFARVLGIDTLKVTAKAKAIFNNRGLVPVAVAEELIPSQPDGVHLPLVYDSNNTPGNVGFVDLDGSHNDGNNELVSRIENGYNKPISISDTAVKGDGIYSETGKPQGAYNEFVERIEHDSDTNLAQCTADPLCKRLVYVPIINTWDGVTGQGKEIDVVGFAVFYLYKEDRDGDGKIEITGEFIEEITQSEFDNKYRAKLIE
ncbi:pilus assembly protein TadG-related protein [Neobacillus sp. LXY-4]|uniref:pilus assembly protein TadG-related protein n=1 Tax=Neobacillus sp. LXY-4 TaxID=3379826 RepID=UPI003EE06049